MQQYPEPIVGAFIINPQGKLFLIKTHKWNNLYCVPGGHIELGETIEKALKREIREETGLETEKLKFLCLWEFMAEDNFWKKKHMLFLNCLVKAKSTNVKLNKEAEDYIWATPQEALKLPLEKYTKLTIEKYLITL